MNKNSTPDHFEILRKIEKKPKPRKDNWLKN